MSRKWRAALFGFPLVVAGILMGLLVGHHFSEPANSEPANMALALTIVPTDLSSESIKQGSGFKTTFSFTNTLNRDITFITNGPSCFQFLDLRILDQDGKNYATLKAGGFYVLTVDEQQIKMTPGETVAGTHSMDLIVNGTLPPGTYNAQAFFDYKKLHFSSNVVRFTVTPQ